MPLGGGGRINGRFFPSGHARHPRAHGSDDPDEHLRLGTSGWLLSRAIIALLPFTSVDLTTGDANISETCFGYYLLGKSVHARVRVPRVPQKSLVSPLKRRKELQSPLESAIICRAILEGSIKLWPKAKKAQGRESLIRSTTPKLLQSLSGCTGISRSRRRRGIRRL